MFIAMNRFRVAKGSEAAFERVWLSRDALARQTRPHTRPAARSRGPSQGRPGRRAV
jgi:heme-degrading monooxygenase HmoA